MLATSSFRRTLHDIRGLRSLMMLDFRFAPRPDHHVSEKHMNAKNTSISHLSNKAILSRSGSLCQSSLQVESCFRKLLFSFCSVFDDFSLDNNDKRRQKSCHPMSSRVKLHHFMIAHMHSASCLFVCSGQGRILPHDYKS